MSIPASFLVDLTPSVLSAGGNPLSLNGLLLTNKTVLPIGDPVAFSNASLVGDYFGYTSQEYKMADTYFSGFSTSTAKPGSLLFSRFDQAATAGWLRGEANALTVAQVKAIKKATAASCTIAAGIMTTSTVTGTVVPGMLVTGTGVPAGTRIVSGTASPFTLSDLTVTVASTFAGTMGYDLSINVDGSPKVLDGSTVDLSSASSFSDAANTLAILIGSSTVGSYASNFRAYTITSGTTGVNSAVDTATGLLADTLGLTSGTASPGSAIMVPAEMMDDIVTANSNWGEFGAAFEVDASSAAYTVKSALAAWTSGTNGRFLYASTNANPACLTANGNTVSCLGQYLVANSLSGTAPIFCDAVSDPNGLGAAFVLGAIASMDFSATEGRITLHAKQGSNVPVSVADATSYVNLASNKTSAYCSFATANNVFNMFALGYVSGAEAFIDNYVNHIQLDADLQLALTEMMSTKNSIPFTDAGANDFRVACQAPIDKHLNFGTIRRGVTLSAAQAADVNAAAGVAIDKVLSYSGYYLKVVIPSAQVRNARGPWPLTLWYCNGESVQSITFATVNVR